MDQNDQLVSRQRPPAGDRRVEPDWYRNTDTSASPGLGSTESRQQREDFATTRFTAGSPKDRQNRATYPTSPFQQAIDQTHETASPVPNQPSPSWYQNAVPPVDASTAANTALAAITDAATTVGNTLAWWGTYLTDIVAEVTGDNEPTEEELQKLETQRLADKEASKHNQGSFSGDVAQPLTRRHSRSSSSSSLMRGASGGNLLRMGSMSRGNSSVLDEHGLVGAKHPASNGDEPAVDEEEDEYVKKAS